MKIIDLSQTIEAIPCSALEDNNYGASGLQQHRMPTMNPSIPQPTIKPWLSHIDSAKSGIYSEGISREISMVQFVTNTGTTIIASYQFHREMASVDEIVDLASTCVLEGVVIDCTAQVGMCFQNSPDAVAKREQLAHTHVEIGPEVLNNVIGHASLSKHSSKQKHLSDEEAELEIEKQKKKAFEGKAVLFYTGFDQHWRSDAYIKNYPFIGRALTEQLVELGVRLVGVDCLSVGSSSDPGHYCYNHLLKHNVLIVENLCKLDELQCALMETKNSCQNQVKETKDGAIEQQRQDEELEQQEPPPKFIFHAAPVKYKGASAFPVRAYATILQ